MRNLLLIFDDQLILWMWWLCALFLVSFCRNGWLFCDLLDTKTFNYCNVLGVPCIEMIEMCGGKPRNVWQFSRISPDTDVKVCFEKYLSLDLCLWNALPISFCMRYCVPYLNYLALSVCEQCIIISKGAYLYSL